MKLQRKLNGKTEVREVKGATAAKMLKRGWSEQVAQEVAAKPKRGRKKKSDADEA